MHFCVTIVKTRCGRRKSNASILSLNLIVSKNTREICASSALSYSRVARWANQFNNGPECVTNSERSENFKKCRIFCRKVRECLESDR